MIDKKTILNFLGFNKPERLLVQRGCTATSDSSGCFCTGRCRDIIGYYENGVYTQIEENELQQTRKINKIRYNNF